VSARFEDALQRVLRAVMERRGWTPRVTASIGYGGPNGVRVFARVLLAPPGERDAPPVRQPVTPRGWRSMLTIPAAGTVVTVMIGGTAQALTSDRGGYVHDEVVVQLTPGWHAALVTVSGRQPVSSRVRVVDAQATHGVVSDIDDTIVVTWLPRPLLAAWNTSSFVSMPAGQSLG
jgi:phosphatidate phosphatase APP1